MSSLQNSRILLIVGGGIAAYKALDLVRRLRERNARVRVVLTPAALNFITALSAASLSGQKAHTDLFALTAEAEMGHIELSRDADLVIVAPATADLLAKMAQGLADDLASTLLLASDIRPLVAPAMNVRMWLHPSTLRNIERLRADGVLFIGPEDGDMACGEFGPGRMAEPLQIVAATEQALAGGRSALERPLTALSQSRGPLSGRKVVITSGPTHEPIDPVRYVANRSSGRQGHAIAAAAAAAGAEVTLISGPVALADPAGVAVVRVETATDMLRAVQAATPTDIFIGAAAVADWRVEHVSQDKIKKKKDGAPPRLNLVENPDILFEVAHAKPRSRLVVGFAAETNDLLANAARKLKDKGCDLIVANDVGEGSQALGGTSNLVHIVTASGVESWPRLDKSEVARRLVLRLAELLGGGA